jgi:hypothetical protein
MTSLGCVRRLISTTHGSTTPKHGFNVASNQPDGRQSSRSINIFGHITRMKPTAALHFIRQAGKHLSTIGGVIMGASCGWMLVSPWLSAHKYITVWDETSSHFWCFLVLIGGIVMFNNSRDFTNFKHAIRLVVIVVAILFGLGSWAGSGKMFWYWKLRSISDGERLVMVGDLEKLIDTASPPTEDKVGIPFEELPESVRLLGRKEDYTSGQNLGGLHGGKALVKFGYRGRSWGLFVGPEKYLEVVYQGCRRDPVATNAFFFIGANDY